MPALKKRKVTLTCPHCGHTQEESAAAYSTTCKKCRQHIRVQELLRPAAQTKRASRKTRQVACFSCGTLLDVPASAKSTMCKRCSGYVDLNDYKINRSVSKNFCTKGTMIIEEGGFLFNTETTAGQVILKGRFIGKLTAEQSLEIHPNAQIKGTIQAAHLIIPPETRLAAAKPILVGSADIAGELAADLKGQHTVRLRTTARFFGKVEASNLLVEEGAVFVGTAKIG